VTRDCFFYAAAIGAWPDTFQLHLITVCGKSWVGLQWQNDDDKTTQVELKRGRRVRPCAEGVVGTFYDGRTDWWEGGVYVGFYCSYIVTMKYNVAGGPRTPL